MQSFSKLSIIVVLSFLFFLGCPYMDKDPSESDATLIIINNTEKLILTNFDFRDYPDTSITLGNPFSNKRQRELSTVLPKSKKVDHDEFKKILLSPSASSKMMIFLFDSAVVDTVPWDTIRTNYMVLKRYDISKEEFQAANWELTINYP